jgi:hypothetical protein
VNGYNPRLPPNAGICASGPCAETLGQRLERAHGPADRDFRRIAMLTAIRLWTIREAVHRGVGDGWQLCADHRMVADRLNVRSGIEQPIAASGRGRTWRLLGRQME